MPTLRDLKEKFDKVAGVTGSETSATEGGETKTASKGGPIMKNMQSIYLEMADLDKTASVAADAPEVTDDDVAAAAAAVAGEEATEKVASEAGAVEETDMMKIAAEYDAAGRIMARGFYDEFTKLAAGGGSPDKLVSPSHSGMPPIGQHGNVHVPTNNVGSAEHTEGMKTNAGKGEFKNSLKAPKTIAAGAGTSDLGTKVPGGSFATVRDVMARK